MNNLYSFYVDCGRMGSLDGLFIATQDEVDKAIGKYMYFGEVLGKHSEVEGNLEAHEIKLVSDDQEKVDWLLDLLGVSVSGFNPLAYIQDSDEDEEEEYEDDE
jgi:hypothetical protein